MTVAEDNVTPGKKLVVDHLPLPTTTIGYASTEELVLAAAGGEAAYGADAPVPGRLLHCSDGSGECLEIHLYALCSEFRRRTDGVPHDGRGASGGV